MPICGQGLLLRAPLRALACQVRSGMSNELAESHGRHARLHADHLEVLEEPSRPSADFFQTLTSRCASPSAWVNSATSASSCSSRDEGPDLPATRAVLPASKNSAFHRPIDCSLRLIHRM